MGAHINAAGLFQSDKYPTCPPGKVPLSVGDKSAQDLLWAYAQRRRAVDSEFSDDLETALRSAGYPGPDVERDAWRHAKRIAAEALRGHPDIDTAEAQVSWLRAKLNDIALMLAAAPKAEGGAHD